MATLYISEYSKMLGGGDHPQVVDEASWICDNNITMGGISAQSNALNINTRVVRLHTDAICSVSAGVNPIALLTNGRLAANQTEYRGIRGNAGTWKFAAITNS